MKFYNREQELKLIEKIKKANGTRFVILKGLRRIGKTRIILEALKDKKYAYVFIPKDKTTGMFLEEITKELKIPQFSSIKDFLTYLFEKYEFVFLDEFQNFYYMDKSVYSDLQKIIDSYKNENKRLCLFIAGSSYSLMKKIFYDYSKALYGRKDIEMIIDELNIPAVFNILDDINIKNIEDKIKFWSIFGGIPKHYEMIEILSLNNFNEFIDILFMNNFKILLDEGNSMLVSEFGGEYKIYFTAIEAISNGKTKLSEIASVFNNDSIMANRYLDLLRKEYSLIIKMTPILESLKSKQGIYSTKNNFLKFWFAFIKRYESYFEQRRINEVIKFFKDNFNTFLGPTFEKFVLELINCGIIQLDFKPTKIGRQWGKIPKAEQGKNQYEIDILALNEEKKEILFAECKWQDNVDAEKIITELTEKSKYVNWNNNDRKEQFAIFAKSFKTRIKEYNGKKVSCFDLKNIEKML